MIDTIRANVDPRERLTALGAGAYAAAGRGNIHAAVLAAASDARARAVLGRVTRTRMAFLERLYQDLGVTPGESFQRARLAYAMGELRHADPDGEPVGPEIDAYLTLP